MMTTMNSDAIRDSDPQRVSTKIDIDKYGYSEDDFEWVRTEGGSPDEAQSSPGAQAVYVIYGPTGFRRMYDRASWQAEFEEDLRNDIFRSGS
ncbi:MAG TPA: hypothetical protein VNO14_16455 [Blastocatellia bacterium]|nr:hypothetical protein [Blastocatellia bacterium]